MNCGQVIIRRRVQDIAIIYMCKGCTHASSLWGQGYTLAWRGYVEHKLCRKWKIAAKVNGLFDMLAPPALL